MKFSREFHFRAPPFFHFRVRLIFAQQQKSLVYQTKSSWMLVFCWYLVREKEKKTQNMSFKNRAILFSCTFSCANHSNSCRLYISAGALRENKTHAKWTKVLQSTFILYYFYLISQDKISLLRPIRKIHVYKNN